MSDLQGILRLMSTVRSVCIVQRLISYRLQITPVTELVIFNVKITYRTIEILFTWVTATSDENTPRRWSSQLNTLVMTVTVVDKCILTSLQINNSNSPEVLQCKRNWSEQRPAVNILSSWFRIVRFPYSIPPVPTFSLDNFWTVCLFQHKDLCKVR